MDLDEITRGLRWGISPHYRGRTHYLSPGNQAALCGTAVEWSHYRPAALVCPECAIALVREYVDPAITVGIAELDPTLDPFIIVDEDDLMDDLCSVSDYPYPAERGDLLHHGHA